MSEEMYQSERFATEKNRHIPVAQDGEFDRLRIGPLEVWPPVVLAPMAGVTNQAFRSLCRGIWRWPLRVRDDHGARIPARESADTVLASSHPDEKPRSVQIYGTDPIDVADMARALVDQGVDHIDMNFGCPVPKVTRTGGGSAVPVKPRLLARIVRAAVHGAGDVPVTIKTRKGISDELLTFLDAGRVAQEEGAAAIGLHARTASELYSGHSDWSAIAQLVQHVSIPVLGNGDIWEPWDALHMMRETGCAGVIVGRGTLGRPWLFGELADVFDGKEPRKPPKMGEIAAIAHDHAERLIELFGADHGMRQMRKWCSWYTVGLSGLIEGTRRIGASLQYRRDGPTTGQTRPRGALPAGCAACASWQGRKNPMRQAARWLPRRSRRRHAAAKPHTEAELAAFERSLSGG